jgi:hypothetical protein
MTDLLSLTWMLVVTGGWCGGIGGATAPTPGLAGPWPSARCRSQWPGTYCPFCTVARAQTNPSLLALVNTDTQETFFAQVVDGQVRAVLQQVNRDTVGFTVISVPVQDHDQASRNPNRRGDIVEVVGGVKPVLADAERYAAPTEVRVLEQADLRGGRGSHKEPENVLGRFAARRHGVPFPEHGMLGLCRRRVPASAQIRTARILKKAQPWRLTPG